MVRFEFMKYVFLILLIFTLSLFLISCDQSMHTVVFGGGDDGTIAPEPEPEPSEPAGPFAGTPRPNIEAELMAMWLSGAIIAPDDLYKEIAGDLGIIRGEYKNSIPKVMISFVFGAWQSRLDIRFGSDLTEAYRKGEFHDWDSLNGYYRVDAIDTTAIGPTLLARLHFEGNLNPFVLEEIYRKNIPGAKYTRVEYLMGDWPNVFPWEIDGKRAYFFRDGWDDCFNGCLSEDVYAFVEEDTAFKFIGMYSDTADVQPMYLWMTDYRDAYNRFTGYHNYIDSLYIK